jgi:hypothetical protein
MRILHVTGMLKLSASVFTRRQTSGICSMRKEP